MPYKDETKNRECRRRYDKTHPEVRKKIKQKYLSDPIHQQKDKEYKQKYYAENGDKLREKGKRDYYANPSKRRDKTLKSKHGISLETYNEMFDNQSGRCAICGKHQSELDYPLCVDHDHSTGKIRGLLCRTCNWGIGMLRDNQNYFMNAISYLFSDTYGEYG